VRIKVIFLIIYLLKLLHPFWFDFSVDESETNEKMATAVVKVKAVKRSKTSVLHCVVFERLFADDLPIVLTVGGYIWGIWTRSTVLKSFDDSFKLLCLLWCVLGLMFCGLSYFIKRKKFCLHSKEKP